MRLTTVICEQCGHHNQVDLDTVPQLPVGTPLDDDTQPKLRSDVPRLPIGTPLDEDE